jgi:hypothetical protein
MNIDTQPILHPAAWRADQFRSADDYSLDLQPAHLREIDQFVEASRALDLNDIEAEHFGYPALRALMDGVYTELQAGRGFVLLRGLPVDRLRQQDVEKLYWAMGTSLGQGLSQSVMGDRLGHVIDTSLEDPNARGYRNKTELNPHTDMPDMVGLCCLRGAKDGGVSLLTSALSIHNAMAAECPQLLAPLYEGFHFHRYGEEAPGESPYTPYRIPVFSSSRGQVSARFIKTFIVAGQQAAGSPLNELQQRAIDAFVAIANRPELQLRFVMQPGEVQFLNNFTTLHARTEFEDHEEVKRRRHMLRLWLHRPGFRPLAANLNLFEGEGVAAQSGKKPSFDLKSVRAEAPAARA